MDSMCAIIKGWINTKRSLGRIVFLEILPENSTVPVTIVLKRDEAESAWKLGKRAKIGTAVLVEGEFKERGISKRGREFKGKKLKIISEPIESLPVDPSLKTQILFDTRLNYRYLLLRTPRDRAIFKVRQLVIQSAREFFIKNGFLEIHTPKICGAGAEGGATVFRLDYFNKTAFLSQSPQLYKQMLVSGLSKVFEITPYFRAEKHHTTRHLNESWGIDAEIGFINNMENVLKVLEDLIVYILKYLESHGKEELDVLNIDLKIPSTPFKRISYSEVINVLNTEGVGIKFGEDLGDKEEKILGDLMREKGYDVYFITSYPWTIKPFYIMKEENLSRSFDLDFKGLEISSGGQREHRYAELLNNIREKGLNLRDFEFYLEAFKYGMPPHGGFGLGVERLMMKILNLKNIREAILFPRDTERLIP